VNNHAPNLCGILQRTALESAAVLPQRRTDLEFVGKYNECFAGVRMVIEFKYFSNAAFEKFKTTVDDFELQNEDIEQIAGYVEGLKQEYPEAKISQHVIYCFGNQG
jgi:hypothetical protein